MRHPCDIHVTCTFLTYINFIKCTNQFQTLLIQFLTLGNAQQFVQKLRPLPGDYLQQKPDKTKYGDCFEAFVTKLIKFSCQIFQNTMCHVNKNINKQ